MRKLLLLWLLVYIFKANIINAAIPIHLSSQSPENFLVQYGFSSSNPDAGQHNIIQLSHRYTHIDFNQTSHIHLRETYQNLPVWNAEIVVHKPTVSVNKFNSGGEQTRINGIVYKDLTQDLEGTSADALTDQQQQRATLQAKRVYQRATHPVEQFSEETIKKIIYVDENDNYAHYAYLISFLVDDGQTGAHRPTMIVDAVTLKIHRSWDQVRNADAEVNVGGIGGNLKSGPLIYDGDIGHLPMLKMHVDDAKVYEGVNVCKFQNATTLLRDVAYPEQKILHTPCSFEHSKHNQVAWVSLDYGETRFCNDEINGANSPSIDAFYAATIAQNLYQSWYGIPILKNPDGTAMTVLVRVHYGRNYENAFWDGKQISFGDGSERFYPMTSLDMMVHEISHGFTDQHSNIDYSRPEMAALHESFSDAAAMAVEYYVSGQNTWAFGAMLKKGEGAIRYINEPTKNGDGIDHLKDFKNSESHAGAGIMNKAFYLLATSPGWNTRKAFDVMEKANVDYWNASMKTLQEAACGMLLSAKDYQYSVNDVSAALQKVGIETHDCN